MYGIDSDGGFVLLTGEVGTGKTTVCRRLLDQLPDNTDIAFILNPRLSVEELLAALCDELHIPYQEGNVSVKVFVDRINDYLLEAHAKGRKTVLIIEEAQNLSGDVLEQIRLLTNLETNERKLLQIIMIGQPELRNMLSLPSLSQLSQRITARYHMGSLSKKDTAAYVNHRLSLAGARSALFPDATIDKLFSLSRGIPRLINVICDRALLGTYVQGRKSVDKSTLVRAAREALGDSEGNRRRALRLRWALGTSVVVLSAVVYIGTRNDLLDFAVAKGTVPITPPPASSPINPGQSTAGIESTLSTSQPVTSSSNISTSGSDQPLRDGKEKPYEAFFIRSIRMGQKGKAVQWLEKHLAMAMGVPERRREVYIYDETLFKQVKKFQLAEGLVSDGIAGPKTIIRLNNKTGTSEPLSISKKEKE